MKQIVTKEEMRTLDQNTTLHYGVPEIVLMEQAANAFVTELMPYINQNNRIVVVCGIGNNGADGIAIARLLNQRDYKACVWIPQQEKNSKSDSYMLQKQIYDNYHFPVLEEYEQCEKEDVIIDAVFGIGLSRPVEGELFSVLSRIDQMPCEKYAVDIPSGVCTNTGEILGCAIHVNHTFTFSYEKIGQLLWPGNEYCGKVTVIPIGITEASWLNQKAHIFACEEEDLNLLNKRVSHSNKGTYGKILIVAGSKNMAGAAYLCAKAAYRTGCGLVKILTHEANRIPLQGLLPEAVLVTYEEICHEENVKQQLNWADTVIIGPGIGTDRCSEELVAIVLRNSRVPTVIDADALNVIARNSSYLEMLNDQMIITPHLGEMSRLTSKSIPDIQTNLLDVARDYAIRHKVICVLKDENTIVACNNGTCYINLTGNNGMATAGSGDVLSGIIGGLMGQDNDPEKAASLGTFIHGTAGDFAAEQAGVRGMTAENIIDGLMALWKRVK